MSTYFTPEYISLPHSNKELEWGKEYPVGELTDVGAGGHAHVKRVDDRQKWAKGLPPLAIKCSNRRFDAQDLNYLSADKESDISRLHEQMRTEWSNHYNIGNADGHAPEPYAFGQLHESSSRGQEYVRFAILMSWVDGLSLDEAIGRLSTDGEALDARKTAQLGLLVAQAVQKLHERGVAHRDLSPNNIRVSLSDDPLRPTNVTLLDFGISISLRSDGSQSTQDLIPTYAYGAPEECRFFADDRNLARDGVAADCWSLGAILYHIRTNKTPHGEAMSKLSGDYVHRGIAASEAKKGKGLEYRCSDEMDKQLLDLIRGLTEFKPNDRPSIEVAIGRLSRMLGNYDAPSGKTEGPDYAASDNKARTESAQSLTKASLLYDEAMDLLSRRTISQKLANEAVDKLTKAAKLNSYAACNTLAYVYRHSSLVPHNYAEAAKLYEKAAAGADDAEAQYQLGLMYLEGLGVDKDAKRANDLFEVSAQKGNIHAKTKVAKYLIYEEKRDYQQAFEHLTFAANAGDAEAQYNLGVFYDEGYGANSHPDYNRAFEWYRAASNQGYVIGTIKVAQFYTHALGPCKKDLREAIRILEGVTESGNPDALLILADIYDDRTFDGYDPSHAASLYERVAPYRGKARYCLANHLIEGTGVPASRERAAELLIGLAESNDDFAPFGLPGLRTLHQEGMPAGLSGAWRVRMMRLLVGESEPANTVELAASLVYDGPHTSTRDSEEAFGLLAPLADQGDAEATYWLGMMHHHGLVTTAGYREEAARLFRLTAERAHDGACLALADCLLTGRGTKKDAKEAASWLRAAADRDNVVALVRLAELYEDGIGVEQDRWEALRLYRRAADQNDGESMCRIGRLYESGSLEHEPDLLLACAWYRRAAERGNEDATRALQDLQVGE